MHVMIQFFFLDPLKLFYRTTDRIIRYPLALAHPEIDRDQKVSTQVTLCGLRKQTAPTDMGRYFFVNAVKLPFFRA